MDYKEIMQLTEWLEKSAFTAYSLSYGSVHMSMSKQQININDVHGAYAAPYFARTADSTAFTAPAVQNVPRGTNETPKMEAAPVVAKAEAEGHVVRSPIVGTYYASATPDKPPLVKVGQAVKKGDVLCILEAMKIMNEICADVDGVVAEVFAENGQMVEARAPLFRFEA